MSKNQKAHMRKIVGSEGIRTLAKEPKGQTAGKTFCLTRGTRRKWWQEEKVLSSPTQMAPPSQPKMAHWLVLRLSVMMRPARAWGSNPEKSWLKNRG